MRYFSKTKLNIFVVTALVLIGCFVGLSIYTHVINAKENVLNSGYDDNEYSFDFSESKQWSENSNGYFYGIQYDGVIENKTKGTLHDWEIKIILPTGCEIDSSWNGEYKLEGNELTITAVEYNDTVEPYETQTFGFVLLSKFEDNIKDCRFIYHNLVKVYELPLFFPVLLATAMLIVSFFVELFTALRTEKLMLKHAEQKKIINQSFLTFANMIDAKDSYTKGHSQRVALYSRELARRLKLDEDEQERIFYIALLHDIGKIGVTDAILKKTAQLTYDEFNEVKEHVSMGGDILKNFNAIEGIEEGARYHHERFDGKGYMCGLAGTNIPLVARIIGVADAFDAMSSARCYRTALSKEKIVEELMQNSGLQFDPDIVPHMLAMMDCGFAPILSEDLSLEAVLGKL